ncbi:MAG: hypothetical protein M9944_03425 [Rhizobiaceae bacterium]|nr:hypothetical protein [Rhizobiaceae bacterium]
MPVRTIGYMWHDSFGDYDAGTASDLPETRTRINNPVRASKILDYLMELYVGEAPVDAPLATHDKAHDDRVWALSDGAGGEAGPDLHMPRGTMTIARRAVGTAIAADYAIMSGTVDNAHALYRDPRARMMRLTKHYNARLAVIYKGGNAPILVPFNNLSILKELCGRRSEVRDPFVNRARRIDGQDITHDQDLVVTAAQANVVHVPNRLAEKKAEA